MGTLKKTENFYIWLFHLVHTKAINHKIEEMMGIHNNNPFSTEVNKYTLHLYQQILSKHQVVENLIDTDTLHFLNEWKGIDSITDGPTPIVVEPPQDTNVTDDEMNHVSNILSMEEFNEEQKHTLIKSISIKEIGK